MFFFNLFLLLIYLTVCSHSPPFKMFNLCAVVLIIAERAEGKREVTSDSVLCRFVGGRRQ